MSVPTSAPPREHLRVDEQGATTTITLDRPRQRNALSVALMEELTAELERQAARPEARVIVLRGEGPAFSAGHDLSELVERTLEAEREIFATCERLMQTVQRVPQPVVAAVHGSAFAAGCQLVAACDLAVAADVATFATPGVRIGLFCSTPMVPLSRAIGRKRALEMLLTGEPVDAATAADWGLVNRVVAPEALDAEVARLAERIADSSPLTMAIGKAAFYEQIDLPQDEAYRHMSETMATNAMTCDAQEGMTAFLEKRAPIWRGE